MTLTSQYRPHFNYVKTDFGHESPFKYNLTLQKSLSTTKSVYFSAVKPASLPVKRFLSIKKKKKSLIGMQKARGRLIFSAS